MDGKVTWRQKHMAFTGTADSGFEVPLGAKPEHGEDKDGFRPVELIAIGLAGCTAMDVISIMHKKRQDVTDFEVQVHVERAEDHPKVFTSAVIEYLVTGHNIDEAALVRAIELSATRYCPAQAMFKQIIPISLRYHIYEQQDGQRSLIKSSDYALPVVE